jgi:hypothetical protein
MLGRNARASGKRTLGLGEVDTAATPMHNLYRKLFPTVLRLAVDLEQVTRQLFAPLATQLVHWLTKNMQRSVNVP